MLRRACRLKGGCLVGALVACLLAPVRLPAQNTPRDNSFAEVPFEAWVAAGPHSSIQCDIRTSFLGLSLEQRLVAQVELRISDKEIRRRAGHKGFVMLSEVKDLSGRGYRDDESYPLNNVPEHLSSGELVFTAQFMVVPGQYTVNTVLYDRTTRDYTFKISSLSIPELRFDPLPDAWKGLPSVEFAGSMVPVFNHPETLTSWAMDDRENKARLWLPVQSRRRLDVNIIANWCPIATGPPRLVHVCAAWMIPLIEVFSQLQVVNGSLRFTVLDPSRRAVLFEQEDVEDFDWSSLSAALRERLSNTVSVQALRERNQDAAFLREELAQRMTPDASDQKTMDTADQTLRVFVILAAQTAFPSGSALAPLEPKKDCGCVVYYVPVDFPSMKGFDPISGILKEFHPQTFKILPEAAPQDLRKALGALLKDIASR